MKRNSTIMRKQTILIFTFFGLLNIFSNAFSKTPDNIAIIPQPQNISVNQGAFDLSYDTVIVAQMNTRKVANQLANILRPATDFYLDIKENSLSAKSSIILNLDNSLHKELGDEGYMLTVIPKKITISAPTQAGLFYACQSLRQLLPPQIFRSAKVAHVDWAIPCVEIKDSPRFKWRGLMLDSSRHFQTKEEVKRFIDLMAVYKLNTFHWHLVDDHGWRLEIKKYPKLITEAAWRDQPGYDMGKYGGFYTQDDVREVVNYAADRFVTVVPEIEMPGHSSAANSAYPELTCNQTPCIPEYFTSFPCRKQGFGKDKRIVKVYCAGNEQTFQFLQDVLDETMALFPSKYIHIGGDECKKNYWKQCDKCKARMKANNLENYEQLQSYFVKRIEKHLNANGRNLIGWGEILQGGLAPNATVMSWRGTKAGIESAKANHDVVMTPSKFLYLDHRQSESPVHPPSWPGTINSLEVIYNYEPVPAELTPAQQKHILGTQANLWTIYTHTQNLVEMMAYPRACALSEIAWTCPELKDFQDFSKRMKIAYKALEAMGVNYYNEDQLGHHMLIEKK